MWGVRTICLAIFLVWPANPSPSQAPPATSPAVDSGTERGRALYNQGYYQPAIDVLSRVLSDRPDQTDAAAALVDCYLMTGRYGEALPLARRACDRHRGHAGVWEALGRALVATGEYEEALAALRRAVELSADSDGGASAAYALGQLYETLGRKDEAVRAYQRFDDALHERLPDDALELTWTGMGFYRFSVLTRHPNLTQRTRHVLQEVYQHAVERVDPRCWRAFLASADLLASKHNADSAAKDYEAARKINHNLPAVYVGLGRLALEEWDFDGTEAKIAIALSINPSYSAGLHLLADLHLTERKYAAAVEACERALGINPNDLEALSRLAAARRRLGEEQEAEQIEQRIICVNPHGGPFYGVMGRWLAAARQFAEAERFFLKGLEEAPESADLRAELGLMYMQWGEEAKARRRLDEAWALDSFDRRTYNTLELLDELERFARHETAHFIIRYSPGEDAVVAPYIGQYMESIYRDVCDDFGHEPADKTIIEIFPSHRKFAVRVTHQPFIHTIGACTGRVIAMDAPRPTTGFGQSFNWAQVLRHEFTHTVTLAATRNRIAHWLTEGLAVYQEDSPRPWHWCVELSRRLRRNKLYSLEDLDWGFIRPAKAGDRQAAYAQSEWMCEYLVEKFGYASVLSVLKHLYEGATFNQALETATGQSPAELDEGFRRWAVGQVRSWNLPADPLPSELVLKGKLLLLPADAGLRAQLAETLLCDGKADEAAAQARQALESDAANRRALAVLCLIADARAARSDKEDKVLFLEEAGEHARRLAGLEADSVPALCVLAELAALKEDTASARGHFERLKTVCPQDPRSYRWLAGHHLAQGDTEATLSNLLDVWRTESSDAEVASQIATIYQRQGDDRQALLWWRQAVHVDPYDPPIHESLGSLYLKLSELQAARLEFEILTQLQPEQVKRWEDLALVYHRMGDAAKTRQAAVRALRLDPNSRVGALLDSAPPQER